MANYLVFPDEAEHGVPKFFDRLSDAKQQALDIANAQGFSVKVWKENLRTGIMKRAAIVKPRRSNPSRARANPILRYYARKLPSGGVAIFDSYSNNVVRTVKTVSAARQVLASMNAKAARNITIPGASVIINPAQGTVSILAPKGTANRLLKGKRGISVTRQKVSATRNPFQRGLDRGWYNAGRKAGRSGKYSSMENAWRDKSEGWNFTPGKRVTVQESFYQGYQDTSK